MKIGKIEKLVANLNDEEEYVIHIRNLREAINHGLALEKVHIFQKTRLKSCFDMNTELRNNSKNDLKNGF